MMSQPGRESLGTPGWSKENDAAFIAKYGHVYDKDVDSRGNSAEIIPFPRAEEREEGGQ